MFRPDSRSEAPVSGTVALAGHAGPPPDGVTASPLATAGPSLVPVALSRPALLVGGVLVALALAGALALVTLRTSAPASTDPDPTPVEDADAPAHPDAWQVRRLLDEHGGRLPQSEIVERTGWSKSKVSRVLSAMADDDQVRKIRIGRENLVTRPGDVPEHAGSPFDDDARNS